VESPYKMLGILRRLSASNISPLILRWIFYYSKVFGASNFHLKTTTEGILQVENLNLKWKWFHAIRRLVIIVAYLYLYIDWILHLNDRTEITLHTGRLLVIIVCSLCILRLQLYNDQELVELINGFLQLFQSVWELCHPQNQNPERMGFGGKQELILLSLMVISLVHEKFFLIAVFQLYNSPLSIIGWTLDAYVSISNQLLMHFVILWYLALGLQFSDLNDFVRTKLRFHLEDLEAKPTRKKLRKARMTLDKCLTLYQDLLSLTSRFQRIYDLIFFLSLTQNCAEVAVFSYTIVLQLRLDWCWMWTGTVVKIINMLLLCLSVQSAVLQFRAIRGLMLENCYLSDIQDWHRTLDMFYTHLSLHELRVCPLGLFKVSNELLLVFLSALINYFTVIVQYEMQQRAV
ncbi:hypothetical protein KR054_010410, partial [Drosophila jambulina]